jgi:hypothetical protein
MSSILQGTTPGLEVPISSEDFLVTDVTSLELKFSQGGEVAVHNLAELTVDAEGNSFTYHFSEAETLALDPSRPLLWQMRFWFEDGNIVGTEQMLLDVADLIGE